MDMYISIINFDKPNAMNLTFGVVGIPLINIVILPIHYGIGLPTSSTVS